MLDIFKYPFFNNRRNLCAHHIIRHQFGAAVFIFKMINKQIYRIHKIHTIIGFTQIFGIENCIPFFFIYLVMKITKHDFQILFCANIIEILTVLQQNLHLLLYARVNEKTSISDCPISF